MQIGFTSSLSRAKIRLPFTEFRFLAPRSSIMRWSLDPVTAVITRILEWRDLASPFPTEVRKAQFERRNASCLPALCFWSGVRGAGATRIVNRSRKAILSLGFYVLRIAL